MDEINFKKLLDEAIAPIRNDLAEVKQTQAEMKDTLDNRILPPVTEMEITLKSYADMYKINKGNIERLDKEINNHRRQT